MKQSLLIKNIAKKFNLREKLIETELEKSINRFEKQNLNNAADINKRIGEAKVSAAGGEKISQTDIILEKELITLLLEGDEKTAALIFSYLESGDFQIEIHKKIAEIVRHALNTQAEIIVSSILDKVEDENIKNYVTSITTDPHAISKSWESIHPGPGKDKILYKAAVDTLKKFKTHKIEKQIVENSKKLAEASGSEVIEYLKLQRELEDSRKEMRDIFENMEISKL